MLRFEKMTVKAQEAVQGAQEVAGRHENQQVEPVHLLAALVAQTDGVVPSLLTRLGIRSEVLSQDIEREIGRLPKVQGRVRLDRTLVPGHCRAGPRSRRTIAQAQWSFL
jgi:ATP-dependent Clp protease ATP-binding subunit ClpB